MRDLQFEGIYEKGDKTYSKVDPTAYAAYKKAYQPISAYEQHLVFTANTYVKSNPARGDIAACDLDWLEAWAKKDALLGQVNKSGEYIRKWLLGSIANTWLQIRDEQSLDAEKKKNVLKWIEKLASAVKTDFSRDEDLKSRQNNHLYWAAWGVSSAAIALDNQDMFDWAMQKAKFGIDEIQANGTMPLELDRRKRAYLYHLFAAMPLFALAEAGYKNGVDLFSENDHGLDRLAALNIKNIGHPADFARMTGEEQEKTHMGSASDLGWVEIYYLHHPESTATAAILKEFRPMKHSRMGGNITLLYAQKSDREKQRKQHRR
jgi:poly(beta-D-mannuronate) lyase